MLTSQLKKSLKFEFCRMSKQQVLPSNTLNSLELTLPGQNSAGKALHPLQQAPKTLAEMEDAAMFNRALQVGVSGVITAMCTKMYKKILIWIIGTWFCYGSKNGATSVSPPKSSRPIPSNSRRRSFFWWVRVFYHVHNKSIAFRSPWWLANGRLHWRSRR